MNKPLVYSTLALGLVACAHKPTPQELSSREYAVNTVTMAKASEEGGEPTKYEQGGKITVFGYYAITASHVKIVDEVRV